MELEALKFNDFYCPILLQGVSELWDTTLNFGTVELEALKFNDFYCPILLQGVSELWDKYEREGLPLEKEEAVLFLFT